jgi:alpha-tubulin suppressor-like RCC1 family protein
VVVISFASTGSGDFHTCGVTTTGEAYCWGSNFIGQLGTGTNTNSNVPVAVSGGLTFQSVSAGWSSTCALTLSGEAYCWGANSDGQVGDGTFINRSTPVPVAGGFTFSAISAGGGNSCALTLGGEAYCWGRNEDGQLGDGAFSFSQPAPVAVSGGLTFSSIDAGGLLTCALSTTGEAYCWGRNEDGQLGDGTFINRSTPVPVAGGLTFSAIGAHNRHACGLTTNGRAYCWGENNVGQLGDGTVADSNVPVAVLGELTFSSMSAGGGSGACGLTTTGEAYCWGGNGAGQLGTADNSDPLTFPAPGGCSGRCSTTPIPVSGDLRFVSISAGGNIGCGLSTDGVLYCWGWAEFGGVGDGTNTEFRFSPVRVLGSG